MPYTIAAVVKLIEGRYHGEVVLQTSCEPAISAIAAKVREVLSRIVVHQLTAEYSSILSESAELAVRSVEELSRTLTTDVDARYEVKVTMNRVMWAWLVRHSGFLLMRYRRRPSVMTSFQTAGDHVHLGDIFPFAEQGPASKVYRADAQWRKGVWLGKVEDANEHEVGCNKGVHRARVVRRRPPSQRGDRTVLESVIGLPWDMRVAAFRRPRSRRRSRRSPRNLRRRTRRP